MYKEKQCKMEGCKVIFLPTSGSQKYCEDCKSLAKRIREKVQWKTQSRKRNNYIELHKKCMFCGVEFKTHYKRKISCGSVECEKERITIKNKNAHKKRDKADLRVKGNKYYYKNRKKCLIVKAESYREKNPKAKEYIPGKVHKHTIEFIGGYVQERGYKLLSKQYKNSKSKIVLKCPNNHTWETTFHCFRDLPEKEGARCAICYAQNNYISKPERLIRDYLVENHSNLNVVYNDRAQIGPKELDFYFPDNKLAVEVCGLYWHGEISSGKPRNYHYNKMMDCFDKGIRLITIFEDELYNNFDVVISRIMQALNTTSRRIYARKCSIKEISSKEANSFFSSNHLQGKSTAMKRWGLFYKDELVSVCSVGNILRKHTAAEDIIELKRLCSLQGTCIIGGASKLFSRAINFAKESGYNKIRSYCDMRYANIFNPVYETLGFSLLTSTKYTPHYFKQGKRYRNYSMRKTVEERLTGKTEFQLRLEQGYDRIWDCGHRTYELDLTNHINI